MEERPVFKERGRLCRAPFMSLVTPMCIVMPVGDIPHPLVGSSWEFYLPQQIESIKSTLLEKRVPYVFVGVEDYKLYRESPPLNRFLETHYRLLRRDSAGSWYINRQLEHDFPAE